MSVTLILLYFTSCCVSDIDIIIFYILLCQWHLYYFILHLAVSVTLILFFSTCCFSDIGIIFSISLCQWHWYYVIFHLTVSVTLILFYSQLAVPVTLILFYSQLAVLVTLILFYFPSCCVNDIDIILFSILLYQWHGYYFILSSLCQWLYR